ncbi:MAG: hypothetical protein ACRDF4_04470, partial [Rhabdochlamydiaceae bacterium]
HIPSHVLSFLCDASGPWGLKDEITHILSHERQREDRTFFASIVEQKDFYGLYPGKLGKEKNYQGASHRLFYFYQTGILGRSTKSLKAAYEIAKIALKTLDQERQTHVETGSVNKEKSKGEVKQFDKDVERLTRSEAFRDASTRSKFMRIMAYQAKTGGFSYRTYAELFPSEGNSVSVSRGGWNLLRYYFGAAARGKEVEFPDETADGSKLSLLDTPISKMVVNTAFAIFERYAQDRGPERFETDVLKRLERSQLGINWLRVQFMKLARQKEGFQYDDWTKLCHPLSELYFQYRLLWSEWLNSTQAIPKDFGAQQTAGVFKNVLELSGIPNNLAHHLVRIFNEYAERRGWERTERDILLRLQSGELGFRWFASKLVYENRAKSSEDQFDEFLRDSQGILRLSEKTFQMSLFLNNLYRIRESQPVVETIP